LLIKLATNCGFCFGVKRAIRLAENNPNSVTLGELIHNSKETDRLKNRFAVSIARSIDEIESGKKVIIRTHGIEKKVRERLGEVTNDVIDATCPFVTKPQRIAEQMNQEGYQVVIFGDKTHPEVKGVLSYAGKDAIVVAAADELRRSGLKDRVALISQTTKSIEKFASLAEDLIKRCKETRIYNTICNATFDNQEAARALAKEADVMLIVGGKNSSNTKQLLSIVKEDCSDSYLVEGKDELDRAWFEGKKLCGISAGASTPHWIIEEVKNSLLEF
jgi:4-hydroxy-3-methylbut-2-enyl diphosphate reductase